MTTDDRFFTNLGKFVAVVSFLFLCTCAFGFLLICADSYVTSDQPTFTVAPDTLKARPK